MTKVKVGDKILAPKNSIFKGQKGTVIEIYSKINFWLAGNDRIRVKFETEEFTYTEKTFYENFGKTNGFKKIPQQLEFNIKD